MTTKTIFKKIELKNFESHEHTILDQLSSGFNCISGESNVGKTSILRAIKLCAYNEFDQKMVRLGADFCEVRIETTRGVVVVQRGPKHNKWTIQRIDMTEPLELDKVGKKAVQQACDVLGIKMIKLGTTEIPVNIMDQLEKHFFIASVGDDKTTGSSRAEIIDEICGLNGAEELINLIALDQYRLTREITIAEERMKEAQGKMFSEADIQSDVKTLAVLDRLEEEKSVCENNITIISEILFLFNEEIKVLEELSNKIESIPELSETNALCVSTRNDISFLTSVRKIYSDYEKTKDNQIRCLQDIDKIKGADIDFDFSGLRKEVLKLENIIRLEKEYSKSIVEIKQAEERLLNLPEVGEYVETIQGVKDLIEQKQRIEDFIRQFEENSSVTGILKRKIHGLGQEMMRTEKSQSEFLLKIDVCPITKKPIGEKCSLFEQF